MFEDVKDQTAETTYVSKIVRDLTAAANKMMQVSTALINFSFKVVAMATKNAAKLAIAAIGPSGKALVSGAKGKVDDKVQQAKEDKAEKENNSKSAEDSASAFTAKGKGAKKINKREDVVANKGTK